MYIVIRSQFMELFVVGCGEGLVESREAVAQAAGAPAEAVAGIAAASEPVVRGLARPPFGTEPATLVRLLRGARA